MKSTGSIRSIKGKEGREILQGYRKLIVYQRIMELVELLYGLARKLPPEEKFGLSSQMRRAAISVISNFVEGYLKKSKLEKDVYLERSINSLHELDAQAEVCLRLKFWSEDAYNKFFNKKSEVGYLLYRYRS